MLSRRDVIAGASLSAAFAPVPLRAQSSSSTGLRVIRASSGAAFMGGKREAGRLLGYDGVVPGPTLRLKRGEELHVRLVNGLSEPTTVHWHGVRVPNAMDGVPELTQPPIAPDASFEYRFHPPDAGTFWYHAHSSEHVDRGLYGALIVEEPEVVDADRDVVLVFGMPADAGLHQPGTVLVNGFLRPDIPIKRGERLRLRLINAASTRGLSLSLEGHAPWVMAVDGQPAEPLVARDGRLGLGPGSRLDVFVDALGHAGATAALLAGFGDQVRIARLVYDMSAHVTPAARSDPRPLPSNSLPARIDLKNALRVELTLASEMPRAAGAPPIFTAGRGRPVNLTIRNRSGHPYVVHLHGHHFRLLDRLDDGWKPYWMDSLVVGEAVERIAFIADNPGKWLIDCRLLGRQDGGTATWFAVS